jgi:hypothetical protein
LDELTDVPVVPDDGKADDEKVALVELLLSYIKSALCFFNAEVF